MKAEQRVLCQEIGCGFLQQKMWWENNQVMKGEYYCEVEKCVLILKEEKAND